MSDDSAPMAQNRSMLRDFLASIATMSGDLSNITAPPFVLDTKSVVEIPSFWAEDPSIFVSPVKSEDPAQRALLVLRSFLSGLRAQCYMGHSPEAGVKKPLNAFLGELFIGRWEDENGTTHMLSEQVNHHPPITACRVWNDEYGVVAEGYNRQTVTFNGSVNVSCVGHILKTLTKYDEHYLMPIPDFKVKGVLSTPYPETGGTYYIPSTTGYHSVIHFTNKGFFSSSSKTHEFTAHLFKEETGENDPLFSIEGHWDTEFTIRDNRKGKTIEVFSVEEHTFKKKPTLILDPVESQDPWETRNAWKATVEGIRKNDMGAVSNAKGHLEQGQRDMRKDEEERGQSWQSLFFKQSDNDKIVAALNEKVPDEDYRKSRAQTEGVWQFDPEAWKSIKKPYHGSLRPDNTTTEAGATNDTGSKKATSGPPSDTRQQQNPPTQSSKVDHTVGAVEDGRPAEVNGTLVDVGRQPDTEEIEGITKDQPGPQAAQMGVVNDHLGSGIEGMSIEEKDQIENMLRDQYSSASAEKREDKARRRAASKS